MHVGGGLDLHACGGGGGGSRSPCMWGEGLDLHGWGGSRSTSM